jgi:hypothetical protein
MDDSTYVQPGTYAPGEVPEYAYCEPVTAGPRAKWHIRKVKDRLFLTGGIDTPSLCGVVRPFGPEYGAIGGWDVNVKMTGLHQAHACPKCVKLYLETTGGS